MDAHITIGFPGDVEVVELNDLLHAMERGEADIPAHKVFHTDLRSDAKENVSLTNTLSATARVNGKLVGFLRVLTDHAYTYYILDVMVHPDWQRKRIGTNMLQRVIGHAKQKGFIKILLTAIPGSEPFYGQFGFEPTMSTVMALRGEDFQEPLS